jgi:rhodanese-related sulfurtransferase
MVREISPTEFQSRRASGAVLLDVRDDWELARASVPGVVHIPMSQIAQRLEELDPARETVVMCRSGGRSLRVAQFL